MFIAGIDGGGTSAKLELRDPDGQRIVRQEFGPFNITGIGSEAFAARLREIFLFCGNMADCASLCIGGAGVTKNETGELVRAELESAGFTGRLQLCGDHEIALRGAMEGPGCILISGTGSIAYGINERGEKMRVGGHGYLIDDRGSGYAIGRDALALTVQTLDECQPHNRLADAVMNYIGTNNAAGIVNYTYSSETGKDHIAALAPVVLETAETGEAFSMGILKSNADALAGMTEVLTRRLKLDHPRIALAGGLLAHKNLYRSIVTEDLSEFAEVTDPAHDALYGAVSLAEEALHKNRS